MTRKLKKPLASLCLALGLLLVLPSTAAAWGDVGHKIVARVAWSKLAGTPALDRVKALVGNSQSDFLNASLWADDVRGTSGFTYSDHWHFVSIPRSTASYEQKFCAGSVNAPYDRPTVNAPYNKPYAKNIPNCVIGALEYCRATLRDAGASQKAKKEALKFIIHFVGDMHQPLHNSEDRQFRNHQNTPGKRYGDRGGNYKFVCFFDECFVPWYGYPKNNNLHSTWDSGMIAHKRLLHRQQTGVTLPEAQYASDLLAAAPQLFTASELDALVAGTPVAWAEEAHAEALEFAYDDENFPRETKANPHLAGQPTFKYRMLGTPYYRDNIVRVDRQLLRAGARLAAFIEQTFAD